LMFLRGDVHAAQRTVTRTYSHEQVIESLRLPYSEMPYFTPGFPLALALIHSVRVASFDGPPTAKFEPIAGEEYISDTGELKWRKGLVVIDTPASQAIVGRGGGRTKNLQFEPQTQFCAVTLSALDNSPIESAGRLLLTAGARVANTGMVWDEKRTTLEKWGTAPSRIEPVIGTVTLWGLKPARAVFAQPLDGAGRPLGQPLPLKQTAEGWTLALGQLTTPWFVIEVTR